jgi:hypothetical protein
MAALWLERRKIRSFSKSAFCVIGAKVAGMKTINHAINGLASSFLLNVGLTSIAEKFDTVESSAAKSDLSSESCWPCNFRPEANE